MNRNKFLRIGILIGLLVLGYIGMSSNMHSYYLQSPGVLKLAATPMGMLENIILVAISLIGLMGWIKTIFKTEETQNARGRSPWYRIAITAITFYLLSCLLFIYSAHLRVLLDSWLSLFYFAGIVVLFNLARSWNGKLVLQAFNWVDLLFGSVLFLLVHALLDLKLTIPDSIFWKSTYYLLLIFNGLLVILAGYVVASEKRLWNKLTKLTQQRAKYRYLLHAASAILIFIPAWWLFYYDVTSIGSGNILRLEILLVVGLITSICLEQSKEKLVSLPSLMVGILLTGYGFMVASYLSRVTDFPMALGWSEGNRLYDYSLIFGKSLYQYSGELNPNYFSPGRYGLWGLPFLIPGLPIEIHRLWNAFLYCVPGVFLGWLLVRDVKNVYWKAAGALGMQLFLNQGPVYPSLTIALILPALFIKSKIGWRMAAILLASYYAGISRFTWVLVIGAWAGLLDLFLHYPHRQGSWIKRLLPTAGIILLGVIPGMAVSWPEIFKTQADVISSQALLWYRLMPNSTYSLGVLPGLLIAVSFMVFFLAYLGVTKKWKLDIWQLLAVMAVLVGFLVSGLVSSSKIGGGSNLHNMDMFMVSLALLLILAMTYPQQYKKNRFFKSSFWTGIFVISMIIPAWSAMWGGSPLVVPDDAANQKVIAEVQQAIEAAKPDGEILFIDQRQLLTFGNIQNVELIPEYEKKYMMDQAMAGNASYFESFYQDLREKRFSLIINETQKVRYQSSKDDFNEENNAWVKWVAEPFLEYYQPLVTYKDYGFTLYIPK